MKFRKKRTSRRRPPDPEKRQRLRMNFLAGLVVTCLLAIVARAYYLQIVKHDYYLARQQRQSSSTLLVRCDRGEILAADGRGLAINIKGRSLFAEPRRIPKKEARRLAARLAPVIKVRSRVLARRLQSRRGFVWLKRGLTPGQVRALEPLCDKYRGLSFLKENRRVYPNRELAGQVLGFVNIDSRGQEGLELYYNKYLEGRQIYISLEHDARSRVVDASSYPEMKHYRGKTLYLTIDRNLQAWTERELEKAVLESRGKQGVAVIMDAENGAILAMAQYPRFNPNSKHKTNPALWRNRAVTDLMEPGSTFKVFTLVAALESGVFKISDRIDCENGRYRVGRRTIHDTHGHGLLRLDEVLKYSSNIGVSKVVTRVGPERFYKVLRAFGFGAKSGIDFPHEPAGHLRLWKRWRAIDLCNLAFGQGVSLTPVQLVTAYAALANGGYRVTPHLVSRIVNSDGWTVYEYPKRRTAPRACSAEVAKAMDRALGMVVEDGGTAPRARVAGYRVAGKTGTSQKFDFVNKCYSHSNYWASFIGYVDPPAGVSRKIVYVMVDEPRKSIYGGVVAAPAFRRINQRLACYYNYPPAAGATHLAMNRLEEDKSGLSGPGPKARKEKAGVPAEAGCGTENPGTRVMPDLTGRSIREALALVSRYRGRVKISGQGRIAAQRPEPGAELKPGLNFFFQLKRDI